MEHKNIDWAEMYRHIAKTQQLIDKRDTCSREETQKILHQRANELAKEFAITTGKQEEVSIIEFMLGNERYGIELIYVGRVSEAKNITRFPSTPKFVEGIINIHGNIICVINLKELFGIPKIAPTDLNSILIANYEDIELGILADAVIGVESIVLHTIQTSLPVLTGVRSEFLKGITHDQKIILNAPKLLTHKELILNDSI